MTWLIFLVGVVCGIALVILMMLVLDKSDGTLYIYPDETGRMCTVAGFTQETIDRLEHDKNFRELTLDIAHLDPPTRKNLSSYNEENATNII